MGLDTAKIGTAVPMLSERADGLAAEAADLYEALVKMHNEVIAFRAELSDLAEVLGQATPTERAARVGAPTPADYFAPVSADRIGRMTLSELQTYCADSAGITDDSCRQAVTPQPVHVGGKVSGHRAHGRFRPLQEALGLESAPASEVLGVWRWLASAPVPSDMPGEWPTCYAYLRAVPQEVCESYLRKRLG